MLRLILAVAVLAAIAVWLAGCVSPPGGARSDRSSTAISTLPQAADAVARGELVLVDVREADEVAAGMAAPALWMPTSRIADGDPAWEAFVTSLPRDRPVGVYCRSGRRSGIAAGLLRARGVDAVNLGGFSEWSAAGLPVRTPDPDTLEIGK
jgi:hydroxyacylglutathione hydrolase